MNQEAQRALTILDNAASAATLTRADHVAVQQSVAILAALVKKETGPLVADDREAKDGE